MESGFPATLEVRRIISGTKPQEVTLTFMRNAKAISRIAAVLLLACTTQLVHAQRGGWTYLGEANVDGQADHDNIRVGGGEGRFRAIQLRVENAAVRFDHVVVHYGNGQSEPINVRSRINAGGQTRAIDLPGDRRVVESVEIWYERASYSRAKPKVRLFGIR